MVHCFIYRYGDTEDYHWIGIEGDLNEAEDYMKKISNDVRYSYSKKRTRNDRGERILTKGLIVRCGGFKYSSKTDKSKHKNVLNTDKRHTTLGDEHG